MNTILLPRLAQQPCHPECNDESLRGTHPEPGCRVHKDTPVGSPRKAYECRMVRFSLRRAHNVYYAFFFLSLLVSLGLSSAAFAGHGFASAFGTMEWLPEPGRTPDSAWYRLDAVREESQLLLSRTA